MSADGTAILFLSASYGSGHNSAGAAIAEALTERRPGLRVEVIDYFSWFVGRWARALVTFSFVQSIRRVPSLYRSFYWRTAELPLGSAAHRRLHQAGRSGFARFCGSMPYRAVVCLHNTPAGAAAELRAAGVVPCPVAVVVTDHAVHSQWMHPGADLTLVPSESVRQGFIERGMPAERVRHTGIPIRRAFAEPVDRDSARREFGLDPSRPVVLVGPEAFGATQAAREAFGVLSRMPGVQVVFVGGTGARAVEVRTRLASRCPDRMRAMGHIDAMHRLMGAADLMVTKAGGITVSEALARGLPLLLHRPLPGHEEWNVRYVTEGGAGLLSWGARELAANLSGLLSAPDRLSAMSERARALGQPEAARRVAEALVGLCGV
ncbi:MAG TPA: glycosyltransferase [Armatimonadota bacterium]|nr:glycosyltransferase [Armatimonadota bacterium]